MKVGNRRELDFVHLFCTKFPSCNLSSLPENSIRLRKQLLEVRIGNWAHVNVTTDRKHTIDLMLMVGAFWALIELIKWRCYLFNMFDMLMIFHLSFAFFFVECFYFNALTIRSKSINWCAWWNWSRFYHFSIICEKKKNCKSMSKIERGARFSYDLNTWRVDFYFWSFRL